MLVSSLLFLATAVLPVAAQAQTGSIAGRLTDQETAAASGSTGSVLFTTLVHSTDGYSVGGATADANDRYEVSGLAPGTYHVRVGAAPRAHVGRSSFFSMRYRSMDIRRGAILQPTLTLRRHARTATPINAR
jgi:hypothetical protein